LRTLRAPGVALVFLEPKFQPESDFLTVLLCMPFLLSYPLVMGLVMHRLSVQLSQRTGEPYGGEAPRRRANLANTRALSEVASRDHLTGLFNRRHMNELLAQRHTACQRSGDGFALALIDLDHFKHINDTHGHATGDLVLRAFADQARAAMRDTDTVGRWVEEFLVVFACSTAIEAAQGVERLRHAVGAAAVVAPMASHWHSPCPSG